MKHPRGNADQVLVSIKIYEGKNIKTRKLLFIKKIIKYKIKVI